MNIVKLSECIASTAYVLFALINLSSHEAFTVCGAYIYHNAHAS